VTEAAEARPAPRPLRLFLLLLGVAALGYLGALFYLAPIIAAALAKTHTTASLPVVLAAQGAQILVLTAIGTFAGVRLAPRVGLDAPFLRALAEGTRAPRGAGRIALEALLVGTVAAALTALVLWLVRPFVPAAIWKPQGTPSFWAGVSSAFYGGTIEEILLRWGVLTALFALARKLGARDGFWAANLLAALLFGLGHLPAVRVLGLPLTPGVLAHVLLGNGVAGVIFGVVFRRRGLEAAMVSHACADVWLHAALPLMLGRAS